MIGAKVFLDRCGVWAFGLGCVAVIIGVLLHLPMFWMGHNTGFVLAGMPMDPEMIFGMYLIIAGIAVAAYGLLPKHVAQTVEAASRITVVAPEDAKLGPAHWGLMAALVVALIIDVMKPASLGFTVPGMIKEYHASHAHVSLVPFFALVGTRSGSVLWGVLADLYGRKASILLSAVIFVGTSICGAMPSLWWNVGMCFLMGAAAGGMLPVTYALLAETMPSRHRGWALVLVGGLGAVGGYVAASGLSAWLQPIFGWRILWFLNLPTGLILIFMNAGIPESAKFLLSVGRFNEARATLRRFGCLLEVDAARPAAVPISAVLLPHAGAPSSIVARTWALSVTAIAWGLINFGLLLWMPVHLVAKGYGIGPSSALLTASALIALPTIFVAAFVYSRWSSKGALIGAIVLTGLGLLGLLRLEWMAPAGADPVWPVALLIVGINGIIAVLLPYAAESYPLAIR